MGMGGLFDNHKSFIAKYADRHLGNCTEMYANYAAERMETCMRAVCDADCFSSQKNIQCYAIQIYIGVERMEMPVLQHALTHRYVQWACGHTYVNLKNWLSLKLIGTQSNRDGIGAKVSVTAGNMTQIREVKSGSSTPQGSDTRLLFGLGEHRHVEKVNIVWQSGTIQKQRDLPINQILTIVESEE